VALYRLMVSVVTGLVLDLLDPLDHGAPADIRRGRMRERDDRLADVAKGRNPSPG